ncbi:MAG: AzlC family ABC transporter permease [Niameybacter sp.]|uniref:AzlC family ABC transporter permease n=1 Tax=Niameybacter sp. TaxID=2033640 RepID=UPI002FCAA26D
MDKKEIFNSGLRKAMPIALGYFPVSFTFGIMAASGGVGPLTAAFISLTNFTSAGQFAGTQLMLVGGPLLEIAVTTFVINIRYMLMSLAISQKLESMSLVKKLILAFGITDETFALASLEKKEIPFLHMLGIIVGPYIGWILGTFCGAYASSLLPFSLQQAMGIALYAMFIALIIPGMKKVKAVRIVVLFTILISISLHFVPFLRNLTEGWKIIIITLLGSSASAWLFPIKEEDFT